MAGIGLLAGSAGLLATGYFFSSSAENERKKVQEMRLTETSRAPDVMQALLSGAKSKVVEMYGTTWAPPHKRVSVGKESAIAKKVTISEHVEVCDWIERMAKGRDGKKYGTGSGTWSCVKQYRELASNISGSRIYVFDQDAFDEDERAHLASLQKKAEKQIFSKSTDIEIDELKRNSPTFNSKLDDQAPPIDYVMGIDLGIGGGETFFEEVSKDYEQSKSINVNVNTNTASGRPDKDHTEKVLGKMTAVSVVPIGRQVYVLGEAQLKKLKYEDRHSRSRGGELHGEEMVIGRPSDPTHNFIFEYGTEAEVSANHQNNVAVQDTVSKVCYTLGGACALGGIAMIATQNKS